MITKDQKSLNGKYLHFCPDFGHKAIDETCPEFQECYCSLPKRKTWFYMRDNHTFRQLTGDVNQMVWQISEELEAGWTAGMLCSKQDPRVIHCDCERPEEFLVNVREFLFDVEAE